MTEYRVRTALRGADLSSLLKYLGGFTTTLGVVVAADLWNEDARWQPSMRQAIEAMEPHLIARERTNSWPGTTSYGEHVRSLYGVGDDLLDTFASRSARLADWVQPLLPADPHFLRADGSVAMGSACCGEDIWLDLRPAEITAIPAHLRKYLRATPA